MRELLNRLFDWLRRDKLEGELRAELDFHRSSLERDAQPPRDAVSVRQRKGSSKFGNKRAGT
jgi:hypothetical protein